MQYEDPLFRLSVFLVILLGIAFGCNKKEEQSAVEDKAEADLQQDKIPQAVMDGLMAKFPGAEIQKWTQETEDDIVIYDFEFTLEDWKYEADIKEDGTIHNWEKALEITDLPEIVSAAMETKYPNARVKEIMEITAVDEGIDVLEGYEIVLETDEIKEVEIMVTPGGDIVEDSGEQQPEES